MAAKKRCKYCKEYGYYHIKINAGSFCNFDHATKWGLEQSVKDKEKIANKKFTAKKKDFQNSDIKIRKKAAKTACHLYIRTRDKDLGCICCGRPLGKNYDAGHWLESGNNPKIRFDEDNIHAQSVYCNQYKGGDSGDYEGNLRKKIGGSKVEWLKSQKGGTMKRTAEDYKEIELYYKQKLKELGEIE